MGLEESYEVPPPCTTAQCLPPQGPNVVYERAYDQYGRPIIVVHQQPPLRTQMYATNVAQQTHNPPLQQMYPGYMQTYQPPSQYPVHTTNPYATVTTAQYPGQYAAQPHPGALLTTPGYYYMPASTVAAPVTNITATNITATVPVPTTAVPVTHANTAVASDTLPVLAPLVSNTDQQHVSNTDQQRVSNTNSPVESTVTVAVTNHVIASPIAEVQSHVTLPGLTPHMSNTDQQHVSNTNLESQSAPLPSNDPEPLVSFSNVTLVNNVLPGVETVTAESNEAKNSSASTARSNEVPSSTESPARVKKSFNPLPRRQPAVKAYLAHEEL